MTKKNLYEKIQAVSMDVMNIEKDMQIGRGNFAYKAVSESSVLLAVKKSEKKHGVLSIPVKQEVVNSEIVRKKAKDGSDSIVFVRDIKMTLKIINLEDKSEVEYVESFGSGIDSGDKTFRKASTFARKDALINAYKIVSGEDPDAHKSEEIKTESKNDKLDAIKSYCLKNENTKSGIFSHFGVGSFDDMTDTQINATYAQFKSKKYI